MIPPDSTACGISPNPERPQGPPPAGVLSGKALVTPVLITLALAMAGCEAFRLERPVAGIEMEIPDAWKAAGTGAQGKISSGWLETFDDKDMTKLVREALENNRNLKATAANLKAAHEGTIIGRASRLPSLNASGSASANRSSNGPLDSTRSESYGLSLNAAWEIDLWGRLRDLDEASLADYRSTLADFRGAQLSLAANTAKVWCNLITARRQATLARETRDSFAVNLRIIERNYKAGDDTASALDVQFSRNNVASAERALLNAKLQMEEAARPLEVLLGRYPSASIKGRDTLPMLPKSVPSGLASDLLMRRPDLVAAQADIFASAKRADAARKNLLPSIRLTGGGSTSSVALDRMLTDPSFIAWSVASSLAQTVYQGGAPSAEARRALSQNEAAIQRFADLALRAFQEVESSLATDRSLAKQEGFLRTEVEQAGLAERQSLRDYSEGIVRILEVLEAQRRAANARNSLINLTNQRIQNRIDLHLALGGDYRTQP